MKYKITVIFMLIICLTVQPVSQVSSYTTNLSLSNQISTNQFKMNAVSQSHSNSISSLPNVTQGPVKIQMAVGGWGGLTYNWREIASSMNIFGIPVGGNVSNYFQYQWLVDRGVKLEVGVFPWNKTTTALDTYYSSTFRNKEFKSIDATLNTKYAYLLSGVRLGDEEPAAGSYKYRSFNSPLPDYILRYNLTFYQENGFYLKGVDKMNITEQFIFMKWMDNRTTSAMNMIYDHVKSINPSWTVWWGLMPGSIGLDIAKLKTDRYNAGGATYTADPRSIYSTIRGTKTIKPNIAFAVDLFGSNVLQNIYFTRENLIQSFWAAYAAGVNEIGYFNFGFHDYGDAQDIASNSSLYWNYIQDISNIGRDYPVINPSPNIIAVGTQWDSSFGSYIPEGLSQYDLGSQQDIARGIIDLSKYHNLILDQTPIWNGSVPYINNYVNNGGNLIVLSGSSITQDQFFNPLKTSVSAFGSLAINKINNPPTYLSVDLTSPTSFTLKSSVPISRYAFNITGSSDFTPIPMGAPEESTGYYSVFLYHNSSQPNSGNVLYVGIDPNADPQFYKSLLNYLYTNLMGMKEGVDLSDSVVGIGLDSQNNLIVASPPVDNRNSINVPVNVTRYLPSATSVSVTRDSLFNKFDALEMGSFNIPADGYINVGDSVFPGEFMHFTIRPNPVVVKPRVFVSPILDTIAVGDIQTITIAVTVDKGFQTIDNLDPEIYVPNNVQVLNMQTSYVEFHNHNSVTTENYVYISWQIRNLQPGQYKLAILVNGTVNINGIDTPTTSELVYAQYGVQTGRIEISVPNERVGVVATGQYLDLNPIIKVVSSQAFVNLTINHLILGMKFGNPGWFINIPFFPTNTSETIPLHIPMSSASVGTIGCYMIQAYVGANEMFNDAYVLIDTYPSRVNITTNTNPIKANTKGYVNLTLSAEGLTGAKNLKIDVSGSSSFQPAKWEFNENNLLLGDKMQIPVEFNATVPGTYQMEITITGSNFAKIVDTVNVIVLPNNGSNSTQTNSGLTPYLIGGGSFLAGIILMALVANFDSIRRRLSRKGG